MAVPSLRTRVSRRALLLVGLGVALPAVLLAALGIYLTSRIARVVEDESARYNSYIALQVGEALERELLAEMRRAIPAAESAARLGAPPALLLEALQSGGGAFSAPHFVSETELPGTTALIVESTPVLYAHGEGLPGRTRMFAGMLLSGPGGEVLGAGGWWFEPGRFLRARFEGVVQDRLPENPRLYGGIVSTRRLSVSLVGPSGDELLRVRQPGHARSARVEPLGGPFEGYAVRVAPALGAPAVWVTRFFGLMIAFIVLTGLVTVVAALAGLRYAARQLELAQLKTSFVSNVTHELKTPIALIRLATETLELRRFSTPQEGEAFLATIGRETGRLQQLVDNILDFARLESGQTVFRFEAVDLSAIVRDTVDAFRPRLEQKGFEVELDLPDGLPRVRGDATMLQHSVLNLLDNALKYSRAERRVGVAVQPRPGAVTVSVRDHGIGIAPEDQKRVFEKFVRVEAGLVHDVRGAGLGLSLVQQIVRAHGGRVELESRPGEGSTFTLVLPLADGTEAPRRGARHERPTDPGRETQS